jgi:hypothetical protein
VDLFFGVARWLMYGHGADADTTRADELMNVAAHPQRVNKKPKADENEIFDGALHFSQLLYKLNAESLNPSCQGGLTNAAGGPQ